MIIDMSTYNGPCIYSIWSSDASEKVYIGKTKNYSSRCKRHHNDLKADRHGNIYLQRLFNKDKELNMCPLDFCSSDLLSSKEIFWISFFKSNIVGYNFTKGGENIPDSLLKWSDERKKAWSKRCSEKPIAKGTKKSKSWKLKMSDAINRRRKEGILADHLKIKCSVTTPSGDTTIYDSIKEAAESNNLAYTYLSEKLKINKGTTVVKRFKISIDVKD